MLDTKYLTLKDGFTIQTEAVYPKIDLRIVQTDGNADIERYISQGNYYGYFLQKANDSNGNIFEVSENVFESYKKNPFWIGEQLYWRISGPIDTLYKDNGDIDDKGVINSNKSSINLASKKIKNIRLYLPNILQFYK